MKQDLNAGCPAVAAIHPAKNMVDTRDTTWFWHDYSVSHWCKSRCVKFSPLYRVTQFHSVHATKCCDGVSCVRSSSLIDLELCCYNCCLFCSCNSCYKVIFLQWGLILTHQLDIFKSCYNHRHISVKIKIKSHNQQKDWENFVSMKKVC